MITIGLQSGDCLVIATWSKTMCSNEQWDTITLDRNLKFQPDAIQHYIMIYSRFCIATVFLSSIS